MSDHRVAIECLGKHKHESQKDADKQAKRKHFLCSYRCSQCGFWHVGRKLVRKRNHNRKEDQ